MQFTTCCIDWW